MRDPTKKRRFETTKAMSQQQTRRMDTIFRKVAEYSLECEAGTFAAIQIRKTGELYIFDSTRGKWLRTLSMLVGWTGTY
jgi:hypothetical protein